MELTGHWAAYLESSFQLANDFGPQFSRGAVREPLPPGGERAAVEAAIRIATVTNPSFDDADVRLLADAGRGLWSILRLLAAGEVENAVSFMNSLLERLAPHPRLIRHAPNHNIHLHFVGAAEAEGRRWASDIVVSSAMLIGSEDINRIGTCAASRCDRVFLDATRNRSQSFCSTQCQNRMKAAALRKRRAALNASV